MAMKTPLRATADPFVPCLPMVALHPTTIAKLIDLLVSHNSMVGAFATDKLREENHSLHLLLNNANSEIRELRATMQHIISEKCKLADMNRVSSITIVPQQSSSDEIENLTAKIETLDKLASDKTDQLSRSASELSDMKSEVCDLKAKLLASKQEASLLQKRGNRQKAEISRLMGHDRTKRSSIANITSKSPQTSATSAQSLQRENTLLASSASPIPVETRHPVKPTTSQTNTSSSCALVPHCTDKPIVSASHQQPVSHQSSSHKQNSDFEVESKKWRDSWNYNYCSSAEVCANPEMRLGVAEYLSWSVGQYTKMFGRINFEDDVSDMLIFCQKNPRRNPRRFHADEHHYLQSNTNLPEYFQTFIVEAKSFLLHKISKFQKTSRLDFSKCSSELRFILLLDSK